MHVYLPWGTGDTTTLRMSVAVYHGGGQEAAMMNPLDVSQTESEYRVVMDLPGVSVCPRGERERERVISCVSITT